MYVLSKTNKPLKMLGLCDDFEPLFEDLSQSYQRAIEDIYKYHEFLQNKMIETEKFPI
jgi:hypothetical protein